MDPLPACQLFAATEFVTLLSVTFASLCITGLVLYAVRCRLQITKLTRDNETLACDNTRLVSRGEEAFEEYKSEMRALIDQYDTLSNKLSATEVEHKEVLGRMQNLVEDRNATHDKLTAAKTRCFELENKLSEAEVVKTELGNAIMQSSADTRLFAKECAEYRSFIERLMNDMNNTYLQFEDMKAHMARRRHPNQ